MKSCNARYVNFYWNAPGFPTFISPGKLSGFTCPPVKTRRSFQIGNDGFCCRTDRQDRKMTTWTRTETRKGESVLLWCFDFFFLLFSVVIKNLIRKVLRFPVKRSRMSFHYSYGHVFRILSGQKKWVAIFAQRVAEIDVTNKCNMMKLAMAASNACQSVLLSPALPPHNRRFSTPRGCVNCCCCCSATLIFFKLRKARRDSHCANRRVRRENRAVTGPRRILYRRMKSVVGIDLGEGRTR
jgi:hypothetical protein